MTCPLEIRIPLSAPHIPKAAWRNVRDCLKTGWVSSVGAYVGQFERNMSRRIGAQHAVATVNGTAALHTALLTAGVGEGDEVLVSTLSFIAPANAIRYVGARPIFVDADPVYWQMDVSRVADFLGKECRWKRGGWINRQSGRRVRAILPVHILGHPCDMKPLLALARKYNLAVIEDATESLGSLYGGRPVGSLGDAACFSFNGNKIITTGGGGMMVTNRTRWARQARYLTTQAKTPGLEYIHHHVGYNYRLTNLQAALGCAELDQLDKYIGAKRRIALRYGQGLGRFRELLCLLRRAGRFRLSGYTQFWPARFHLVREGWSEPFCLGESRLVPCGNPFTSPQLTKEVNLWGETFLNDCGRRRLACLRPWQ